MALPTRPSADDLTALSKLTINTSKPKAATSKLKPKKKEKEVIDSWEDEADLSGSDTETEADAQNKLGQSRTLDPPDVPPPTPASPVSSRPEYPTGALAGLNLRDGGIDQDIPHYGPNGEILPKQSSSRQPPRRQDPDKRPDKTTSVAARLIAGGLGVRAPKRTEEEREYDRVTKEKAKKKRDEERAQEKANQAGSGSAWQD